MSRPVFVTAQTPSVLNKLEAFSPGARDEILAHANRVETARRAGEETLTARFLRFCHKAPRDIATRTILGPGPYGMGTLRPDAIELYNKARADNAAEDAAENLARSDNSLRFAIFKYMRSNSIHGSYLRLSEEESASLRATPPGVYRTLARLAP